MNQRNERKTSLLVFPSEEGSYCDILRGITISESFIKKGSFFIVC